MLWAKYGSGDDGNMKSLSDRETHNRLTLFFVKLVRTWSISITEILGELIAT